MDHIKALYEEEIQAYKQQINELRLRNRSCDEQNAALIDRVGTLEGLIDKANLANKDLNMAFEHVREENLRIQMTHHEPEPPAVIHVPEPRAIEVSESFTWITEKDRMNQRIKYLERECARYHRDNTTLGKQVRHLLRSLEEERGMIIRHESQVDEEDRLVCAADVIDKHLITFESIEQLQQQNQKLISLVKNLSAEQEEKDMTVESEEVRKLTTQIEELSRQLEIIKGDRERVLSALKTIHKERDLFKILLCKTRQVEHITPEIFQRMVSVACSSGPAIEDHVGKSAEKEAHLEDLKNIISKLEARIENLTNELCTVRKESNEEIKLKDELLQKAHLRILDETKRADTLHERTKVLECNIQALTCEFDECRVKCQKLTFENEEIKKSSDKDAHIDDLKSMIQRLEGYITDVRKELDNLRKESSEDIKHKEQLVHEAQLKLLNESRRADALQSLASENEKMIEYARSQLFEMQKHRDIERRQKLKFARKLRKMCTRVQRPRHQPRKTQVPLPLPTQPEVQPEPEVPQEPSVEPLVEPVEATNEKTNIIRLKRRNLG